MEKKKLSIIFISIIILAGFLVYFNSLNNGFVYDDELVIKDNPFLASLSNIKYLFSNKYFSLSKEYSYRPGLTLTYILDYYFFKGKLFGFHLTNIVIHIINALLLYCFILFLIPPFIGKRLAYPIAFLSGILFVLHPVQTEVVNGIAFREDALYTLFFFLSLISYLKSKFSKKFIFYAFSLFCYLLALLSKESAIILPLFIFLIDLFYKKIRPKDSKQLTYAPTIKFNLYLGYIIVLGTLLFIRFFVLSSPESFLRSALTPKGILKGPGRPGGSLFTAILTTSRIFISYITLLFFPFRLEVERVVSPSYSLFDLRVILSMVILILLLIFFLRNFNKRPLISFSGFWFFLCLLPIANVMPLYHAMAERYLYLACAGFCLFLGTVTIRVFSFPSRPLKIAVTIFVLVYLGFFAWRTVTRNKIWKDNFVFCQERTKYPPVTERIYSGLGVAYTERGMLDKAEQYFKKSLEANPKYFSAYYNLGNLYYQRNFSDKAEQYYKKAIELNPYHAQIYNNLGNIYFKKELYDEAQKNYKKTLELSPLNADARNNLGNIYLRKGLYDRAEEEYKEALRLNPRLLDALSNLAALYAARGLYDKAIEQYQDILKTNPRRYQLYYNLGIAYYKKGLVNKAVESFQKALEINPNYSLAQDALTQLKRGYESTNPEDAIQMYKKAIEKNPLDLSAHNNLANLYLDMRQYDEAIEEYKKVLQIDPKFILARHNLANVYFLKGLLDEAQKNYEKVLEIEPNFLEAYNNLGVVYYKKGFPQKARQCWQKALELNPGYSKAKENLKLLQDYAP